MKNTKFVNGAAVVLLIVLVVISNNLQFSEEVKQHIDYCEKIKGGAPNYRKWPAEQCSAQKIEELKKYL